MITLTQVRKILTILNDDGTDTINGGNTLESAGDMMLFKANSTNGVVVNLSSTTLTYNATSIAGNRTIDTFGNTETVTNIENITGTANKRYIAKECFYNALL